MTSTAANMAAADFPDLATCTLPPAAVHPMWRYPGFEPGSKVLPKGHMRTPESRAFPTDVLYERDQAIPMRDGITIYTDVFRPTDSDSKKVPALIPWSPYGKTGTGIFKYEIMGPFSCGVPAASTSDYDKFEGPDPAEWCGRGYAIINVDARGAGMSEGNLAFWGLQEAEDIYDAIDWVSKQPWCTGAVGMVGNSWLAISQLNFASRLTHPALKALAPMEAATDMYNDLFIRGGRPHNLAFNGLLLKGMAGSGSAEDMPAMGRKHPVFDEYWESKFINTENVDVPLYLTASYSSGLHTRGSFNTFRNAKTSQKWLRVHPYQEWFDLYRPEIVDDLQRFFDHFCKGVENGWEQDTPPVRLSLMGFENSSAKTIVERPEQEYPLARQMLKSYYLDARTKELAEEKPVDSAEAAHQGHSLTASTDFTLHFTSYTEIAGYIKAILYMSCASHSDLDVTVQVRKIDTHGNLLEHLNYPCPVPVSEVPSTNVVKALGPQGFLRASHAITRVGDDENQQEVEYTHDRREAVTPGSVVKLEITLWPTGMVFAEGEGLMLRIAGHDMNLPEVEMVRLTEPADENKGEHVVYTGGERASFIVVPTI